MMGRNHALDYARAIMLTLGIPYHIACAYQIGGGWVVDAQQPDLTASILAAATHSFRMPAFFVLSGYFASMVLARRKWHVWLKDRAARILLPAVATAVLMGPIIIFIQTFALTEDPDSSMQAMINSLPFGSDQHAWFLVIIFAYCLGLAITGKLLIPTIDAVIAGAARTRFFGNGNVALISLAVFMALWAFVPSIWIDIFSNGKLSHYLSIALEYLPYFLVGVTSERATSIANSVFRPGTAVIVSGIIAAAIYVAVEVYRQSNCAMDGACGPLIVIFSNITHGCAGMFTAFAFFG